MIHACFGMHCPWEDSRGECRWHKGNPFPCELEELEERDREEFEEDACDDDVD